MAGLLGRLCTYRSTTTNLSVQAYVVSVRTDDRLQVHTNLYQVPDDLPWRPRSAVTVLPEVDEAPVTPVSPPVRVTVPLALEDARPPSYPLRVFVKYLRKKLDPQRIQSDFNGTAINMISPSSCTIDFDDLEAYQTALAWHHTYYKDVLITVTPSAK